MVGFMGVGKTTIGRLLARRLGMPFVNMDREMEKALGLSVAEILARHGQGEFRKMEREMIANQLGRKVQVIAVGGGSYEDAETRAAVNEQATAVWLDPPFELILERVARSSTRPLALGKSSKDLRRLWDERRKSYAEAHVRIVTRDAGPEEAVDRILEALA